MGNTRVRDLLRGTAAFELASGRRHRKKSYAQHGEDLHILSYYDALKYHRGVSVDRGCIVDIGAFRPITLSNSYLFHKRGWHSINVDPTPGSKRMFDRVRATDTNLELAVGQESGRGDFFVFGAPSVWNTFDPDAAERAARITGTTPTKVSVPIARLDEILDEHLKDRPFELLSIDAEGHDIEVLRSNDFARHRPRLVLVEAHDLTLDTLPAHPVVRHLRERDYRLHSWINPNLLFAREDAALH